MFADVILRLGNRQVEPNSDYSAALRVLARPACLKTYVEIIKFVFTSDVRRARRERGGELISCSTRYDYHDSKIGNLTLTAS